MTIHFNLCKLIKAKKEKHIFSHFHSSQKNHSATRCSHRSTRLKIRGKGLLRFLPKWGVGVDAYWTKLPRGFPYFRGFSFLLISFLKICPRGLLCYTPLTSLCAFWLQLKTQSKEKEKKSIACLPCHPPQLLQASLYAQWLYLVRIPFGQEFVFFSFHFVSFLAKW